MPLNWMKKLGAVFGGASGATTPEQDRQLFIRENYLAHQARQQEQRRDPCHRARQPAGPAEVTVSKCN